jgi:hypothetical protein
MGRRSVAALAVAAMVLPAACAGRMEHALLERFFELSRLRDKTALAPIATVVFEPLEQGIVDQFSIVRVAPEERSGSPQAEIAAKEVTVDADVRGPDGTTVKKRLIVTMQRLMSADTGAWKITGVAAYPQGTSKLDVRTEKDTVLSQSFMLLRSAHF